MPKYQFSLHDSHLVTALAMSPDGAYLATTGMYSTEVHIWDLRTRTLIKRLVFDLASPPYNCMAWSPDSQLFATSSGSLGRFSVYRAKGWTVAHVFEGAELATGTCNRSVFSSEGAQIALLGSNIAIIDIATWRVRQIDLLQWNRGRRIIDIAFIPSTHDLLCGGLQFEPVRPDDSAHQEQAGYVWSLKAGGSLPTNGRRVYPYPSESGGFVIKIAVRSDGQEYAVGAPTLEGTGEQVHVSVHFDEMSTSKSLGAPLDNNSEFGEPGEMQYSLNGKYLFVAHVGKGVSGIHILDAYTHKILGTIKTRHDVYSITATADGTVFAAPNGPSTVAVWQLKTQR